VNVSLQTKKRGRIICLLTVAVSQRKKVPQSQVKMRKVSKTNNNNKNASTAEITLCTALATNRRKISSSAEIISCTAFAANWREISSSAEIIYVC